MDFYVKNIYYYIEDNVKKYFTYIGQTDVDNHIYGGEIGLADENRDYITIDNLKMVLFVDKLLVIERKNVVSSFKLHGKNVVLDSNAFNNLINALSSKIISSYSTSIINESNKNLDANTNQLIDITFPEKIIRLLEWNIIKKRLKFNKDSFVQVISKFNVYFAYCGTNIGSEIDKLRPVLIWKQHVNKNNSADNSYFVFPISSKKAKKKYCYNIEIMINGKKNYIRINDGRRISIRRIFKPLIDNTTGKTYVLGQDKIDEVKDAIKKYFSL